MGASKQYFQTNKSKIECTMNKDEVQTRRSRKGIKIHSKHVEKLELAYPRMSFRGVRQMEETHTERERNEDICSNGSKRQQKNIW